ncbi:hypothetical protein CRUP_031828 [Coryphaenoides rupestris]|nr:hypothetical protein CRUP_031828 [Coryphaenoides rupestris]
MYFQHGNSKELPLLEAEVLQVHAPPFVSKETNSSQEIGPAFSRVQRRRSFIKKKKRDRPVEASVNGESANRAETSSTTEDISVPKDLDLIALPQLCFPGGLQLANEQKDDSYHFLVFTDVFGNRTHGVVVQHHRSVQVHHDSSSQNGHRRNSPRLYAPFAICIISKFPYYNALRDCLSCLLVQLRLGRQSEFEEAVKELSAKLSLVPLPPPGQLHVSFSLRPLQIMLPSREAKDRPVIDINLHLPLLCFTHTTLLQVLSCLLQEERVVLFSSDWARLTLVAESLLLYLQPLSWQQPYVPVLARGMLDFLMAPTAFLMGCHVSHFEEVAAETEDLILVNIDDGSIQSSWAEQIDLPCIPLAAADCFVSRVESLQLHYDLELCHSGAGTDTNERRAQRRDWQHHLNTQIQNIALELVVNIFREVQDYLNYEHRVFNSEEFLRTRELSDQTFYKTVLDTHIFHSFLRDRLNRKLDAYSRMELNTRNSAPRNRALTESPRRPPMSELSRRGYSGPEQRLSRRLGASLPNLDQSPADGHAAIHTGRLASLRKISPDAEFPPPLAYHYVQNYYSDMRLDALEDFQSLYKTDAEIFPPQMVKSLVDSLPESERSQRFISRIKREQERERSRHSNREDEGAIKRFHLPKKHMQLEEFVKCVQESGMVKDQGTIHRLFDALTSYMLQSYMLQTYMLQSCMPQSCMPQSCMPQSCTLQSYMLQSCTLQSYMPQSSASCQQKQVGPDLFRVFYTIWKETEAEAQELSSSVKTSRGVGKIAMTQRRLFLLTDGRPGYVEAAQYRDIEVSSAALLLLRIPSLKLRVRGRKEAFEANLKTETELWNLMTTAEVLKHKINPSLELTTPHAVDVLLYTPGAGGVAAEVGGASRPRRILRGQGQQKQVGPDLFRVFYTIWKETEAEAQESVTEHLEPSECVFKLSSSVKTSRGVGKIAMTQRRLFLLTDGRPGYVEAAQYRDIEVSSAALLLLRIPSLKLRVRGRKEAFEANLKTETELWNLMVKEMRAGRSMADLHKTTAEVLKHKINPSLELTTPHAVDVLLYTPGAGGVAAEVGGASRPRRILRGQGQLWVSVSGGKVMVFDASSWGKVYILDTERHMVLKELQGHADRVTALCSAEDRYALSGAGKHDGKIAIWKVE